MLTAVSNDQPFVDLTLWAQDIWLEAGVSYEFSYYLAKATGVAQVNLFNRLNGVQFSSSHSNPTEDLWGGHFTSLGVATSGIYTLSIADLSTGSGLRYAVDNISLTYEAPVPQVPLPAGGVLFLTALMGLAAMRRHR